MAARRRTRRAPPPTDGSHASLGRRSPACARTGSADAPDRSHRRTRRRKPASVRGSDRACGRAGPRFGDLLRSRSTSGRARRSPGAVPRTALEASEDVARVAVPAPGVEGAAEHDGVEPVEVGDVVGGVDDDVGTRPRRTSPIASATSRVEPCFVAYATRMLSGISTSDRLPQAMAVARSRRPRSTGERVRLCRTPCRCIVAP